MRIQTGDQAHTFAFHVALICCMMERDLSPFTMHVTMYVHGPITLTFERECV